MAQKTGNLLRGIPCSPGIVIGQVYLLKNEATPVAEKNIPKSEAANEIKRFRTALQKTKEDLSEIQKKVKKQIDENHAQIFGTGIMFLEDPMLIKTTEDEITETCKSAEWVFQKNAENLAAKLQGIKDPILRDRVVDFQDIVKRVLNYLVGGRTGFLNLAKARIIISHNLSPSDIVLIHRKNISGFATDAGTATSHTAIVAKSLEIPAVMGLKEITGAATTGDTVIVDGTEGIVIANPSEADLEKYTKLQQEFNDAERRLFTIKDLPSETTDGRYIDVSANIELPVEVESAIMHGAKNIGLYRTEFLFLTRKQQPSEEEQFQAYSYIAERLRPNHAIIRTMDLGGDKLITAEGKTPEQNPYMGWRSIRVCLNMRDMFETQLRAIFRASAFGNLKIMFPMISKLSELQQVLEIVKKVKADLSHEKIRVAKKMEIGIMIEVPSAALVAEDLAKEIDFFSIGTNDLIQFTLAVDRNNEKISNLADPHDPAILRQVKQIINSAHNQGIWTGICGEMTRNPLTAILLSGMEIDSLSMSPSSVLSIKRLIRSISFEEAKEAADYALTLPSSAEINAFLEQEFSARIRQFTTPRPESLALSSN